MPIDNVEGPAASTAAAGTARHVEMISVEGLAPHAGNPRTHSMKQIRQLAKSIDRFGFTNPILLDDRGQIVAGHGRVEAAKLLGMAEVPALRLSHLSDAERRAYVIADNRLAEQASRTVGDRAASPDRSRVRGRADRFHDGRDRYHF